MKNMIVLITVTAILLLGGSANADTWTIVSGTMGGQPTSIQFSLDGRKLSLNCSSTATSEDFWYDGYHIMSEVHEVLLNGTWAACGTVVDGELVPDQYASFVADDGSEGHIQWAANTPVGYGAQLMLGAVFNGNGAIFYRPMGVGSAGYGTVIRVSRFSAGDQQVYNVEGVSHTFTATYVVPEPSSILAILCSIGGLGGMLWRRR